MSLLPDPAHASSYSSGTSAPAESPQTARQVQTRHFFASGQGLHSNDTLLISFRVKFGPWSVEGQHQGRRVPLKEGTSCLTGGEDCKKMDCIVLPDQSATHAISPVES